MPIQQDKEIVASEVNTKLNIPDFLKQNDEITVQQLINRFGQANVTAANITVNSLITPNQLNNISVNGIPGTGGLDGTYNGVSFQQALEEKFIDARVDNNGDWMLYLKVIGNTSIEFSSFGTKGNKIDYFIVGGGGGGINDKYTGGGYTGGGGYYYTSEDQYTLALNTPYTISVGKGGNVDEDGEQSAAFNENAPGGKKGQRRLMTYCTYWTEDVTGGRVYYVSQESHNNGWKSFGDDKTGTIQVVYKLKNEKLENKEVEVDGVKCGGPNSPHHPNKVFVGKDPYRFILGMPDDSNPIDPEYKEGSNGEGQNTPVRPFKMPDTSVPVVCGVASSKDSATIVYGQGGAANGGKGTQGVVILRNAR